jgi:MtN3 and saliva related transmembrane protein
MENTELIGYFAATLTTASFAPQAYLVWKTRNVESVSLGMYTLISIGLSLWLTYGFMIKSWPVMLANGVTLLLTLFILAMKLRCGKPEEIPLPSASTE